MPQTDSTGPRRFGTLGGVFTPCVLTILGVILFLRQGQVVGEVGVYRALWILLAAKAITLLTGLSLAAIATNTRTRGGGAYFLISRSLGVEYGGAIGIVFFLAQAISVALYAIGFAEAFVGTFPALGLDVPLVATIANLVAFLCVYVGAGWAIRLQYGILAVLGAAIGSFLAGAFQAFDVERFQSSLGPAAEADVVMAFALFFPAVTGIMAGANMSGDLADPARSIPRGTLAAIAVTGMVYAVVTIALGGAAERVELQEESLLMSRVAVWPTLIVLGIFSATASSALGSMMGAPRILQAFARDRVLPGLSPLAKGSGASGEPRRATWVTYVIAQLAIMLGDLDAIAPVITMAFLITYGTLNLATFYEGVTGNPSYRPRFRWCPWWLSLVGALGCGGVMVLLDPLVALGSVLGMAGIFWLIRVREVQASWGDLRSGVAFARARRGLMQLEETLYHPKNWRPVVLAMIGASGVRQHLAVYGSWLSSGHGILSLGQVIRGSLPELVKRRANQRQLLRASIRERELEAFPAVVAAPSLDEGIVALVQSHGLGGLEPNTVLFGWPEDPGRRTAFAATLRTVAALERSLVVVRSQDTREELWSAPPGTIDVWWRGRDNGPLMLLFAHLIRQNRAWRGRTIRLLRVVASDQAREEVASHLTELATSSRIDARAGVIVSGKPARAIAEESRDAGLVILGFSPPPEGSESIFFEVMERLTRRLQRVLLVWSAGGVELES